MGGAFIEQDTTLLPLSLVLKEMNLRTGIYEGSPAQLVGHSTLPPSSHRYAEAADIRNRQERVPSTKKSRL
jgi:hypothetical protein